MYESMVFLKNNCKKIFKKHFTFLRALSLLRLFYLSTKIVDKCVNCAVNSVELSNYSVVRVCITDGLVNYLSEIKRLLELLIFCIKNENIFTNR